VERQSESKSDCGDNLVIVARWLDHSLLGSIYALTSKALTGGFCAASPTQQKVAPIALGRLKRDPSAMTRKMITLEFVLPTALAIALGILLSIGAVYLTDHYLGSVIG
jgi:hypothetical protein